MTIDHAQRLARFAVGELATFAPGPRSVGESGPASRWRRELGSHWHREAHAADTATDSARRQEVSVSGTLAQRGWRFELEGRIDQLHPGPDGPLIRELKTTLLRLPAAPSELRAHSPGHFVQLGLYLRLHALADPATPPARGELVFIEAGTGLQQVVPFSTADETATDAHLDLVADFLEERRADLARLRSLTWRPAFATPRPGQETIVADLQTTLAATPVVVLAAPTGYGKTGVLLETAFAALRSGRADRLVYLTGKSTGQLHVLATLDKMLASPATRDAPADAAPPLVAWNLRPKREHCINDVYHCTRERCRFLHDLPRRYRAAGLARFHLFPTEARDLPALRAAGLAAEICPYEIARAALPAASVWLGDFNYLFAPANRGVFVDQPTWDPARTLLVIDEAHHLPARVADAHSHALDADELHTLLAELPDDTARPLRRALEGLWRLLAALPAADALDLDTEDDLAAALRTCAATLEKHPPDLAALPAPAADLLFRLPALLAWLEDQALEKLLWCPRPAALRFTCLDAAPVIGEQLRSFAGVILATATPPPPEVFAAALGLDLLAPPPTLAPPAPWRAQAYDVALDLRVDTSFRQRERHHPATAATLATLRAASSAPVAAFFPSYAYAEKIIALLADIEPGLRCALQPRAGELAAQSAWIEEHLALSDVLCFVLGGSFAEGIDHLGGRITHAMVVGPALPEVNALQRAREAALARHLPAAEAFRRTYLVPGLQKVNQALGRLARAPGQHCKVLLHCRRFADPAYAALLAPEYQFGRNILETADLDEWIG
ncbi:MAG: helicase [Verrucomicrobia bacterium]|nr:helicase [Verrucomicrobiota bacterium]